MNRTDIEDKNQMQMLTNRFIFDPNETHKQNPWATYCLRSPMFKLHQTRAHACSAILMQHGGALYKHDGEKWVEIFNVYDLHEYKQDVEKCEVCNGPLQITYGWNNKPHRYSKLKWVHGEKESQLLVVCSDCNRRKISPNIVEWGDGE